MIMLARCGHLGECVVSLDTRDLCLSLEGIIAAGLTLAGVFPGAFVTAPTKSIGVANYFVMMRSEQLNFEGWHQATPAQLDNLRSAAVTKEVLTRVSTDGTDIWFQVSSGLSDRSTDKLRLADVLGRS